MTLDGQSLITISASAQGEPCP